MTGIDDTAGLPGRIGPWTPRVRLGEGGNAVVYRAIRDEQEGDVALKVLKTRDIDSESYQRFVREIKTLEKIGAFPGVLPLVEADLPTSPTKSSPAWLAMPIAMPLAEALDGKPLESVVGAIAAIGNTLAQLKQVHQIAHRDVKPGNLYHLDDEWLIGDFGLVAAPDIERMTREGRQVGPVHFTAHEMISDPVNADPFPADVYSLAKTLWVIATGQNYPPDGHQEHGTRGFSIAELRPHPHADALDKLVDVCTLIHPEKRSTMGQLVADLEAWARLESGVGVLEVAGLGDQIRAKMKEQLEQEDIQKHLRRFGQEAARLLQDLVRPFQETFKEVHPHPEFNLTADRLMKNMLLSSSPHSASVVFKWYQYDRLAAGDSQFPYSLRFGRSVEVVSDGDLIFRWYIHVGREGVGGGDFWQRETPARARAGSIEAERMLREGVSEMRGPLEAALKTFVKGLPAR